MEEKSNSIWKDALKPSLMLSLILIIFSVLIYVFDLIALSLFAGVFIGLISLAIMFVSILFLMKAYRNDRFNGLITYGKAFGFGVILGLYASVILSAYDLVFNNVIDPDYEKNITIKLQEKTEAFMIEKGVPDDTIEEQIKQMEKNMNKPPLRKLLGRFLGNFVFAVIASLIAAAIVKKNPDPYQTAMQDIKE